MTTTAKLHTCLILFSLLLLLPFTATAQTPGDGQTQASQPMTELIQLLKEQQLRDAQAYRLQKLEIAVSYLDFRSRRIEAREQELKELKHYRERIEEVIVKLKENPEQWDRSRKQPSLNPQSEQSSDLESRVEFQINQLKERLDRNESEIIILENEILELNRDLVGLEAFVEKNLKLIP